MGEEEDPIIIYSAFILVFKNTPSSYHLPQYDIIITVLLCRCSGASVSLGVKEVQVCTSINCCTSTVDNNIKHTHPCKPMLF